MCSSDLVSGGVCLIYGIVLFVLQGSVGGASLLQVMSVGSKFVASIVGTTVDGGGMSIVGWVGLIVSCSGFVLFSRGAGSEHKYAKLKEIDEGELAEI